MKATVLIDNLTSGALAAEWGLAIHIDYDGHKILLDTGATERFAQNAGKLGIDLNAVELGVLSHAHYDHAGGLAAFFARNTYAPIYLRQGAKENCYGKRWIFHKYIGIPHGFLRKYADRFRYTGSHEELLPGVHALAHHTDGLKVFGEKNHLYVRQGRRFLPDAFAHEQTLVFETEKGLAVFSGCSHGGVDNIIKEVLDVFPGRRICAVVGGFHLFHTSQEDVRALARRLREIGAEQIYTGHCTGQAAYQALREELGEQAAQLHTGMEMLI
ncbi:MAG: MBL fold metallo-hydrolase [Oscillospiraceae bacterium]|nr:MBL fold metallo-hydrolase [Oscillospiraceae bacterium]